MGSLDVGVVAAFRVRRWPRPCPRHPPGKAGFCVRWWFQSHPPAPVSRLPTPANNVSSRPRRRAAARQPPPHPRKQRHTLIHPVARCLSGSVVQNASESHRIHPNPAKTTKPRRISDHPRAKPAENSETQTHFGPPTPTATRIPGEAHRSRSTESAAGGLCPFVRRPGNPSPGPDGSHRGGQSSSRSGGTPIGGGEPTSPTHRSPTPMRKSAPLYTAPVGALRRAGRSAGAPHSSGPRTRLQNPNPTPVRDPRKTQPTHTPRSRTPRTRPALRNMWGQQPGAFLVGDRCRSWETVWGGTAKRFHPKLPDRILLRYEWFTVRSRMTSGARSAISGSAAWVSAGVLRILGSSRARAAARSLRM